MAAIQIAPVAERAGVAAGTVYRYFPGKIELVGALVESVSEREIEAVRRAADAAPGPLSALAAAIATFGARALARSQARLGGDRRAGRHRHRCGAPAVSPRACRPRFEARIRAAIEGGHLPEQDAALAALGAASARCSKA